MLRATACGLSDVGRSRTLNEDCFAIDRDAGLYLVADGMGGHGNGEIASRVAAHAVRQHIARGGRQRRWGLARGSRRRSAASRLRAAIDDANRRVLRAVEKDQSLVGMGTTIVALVLADERATVAHVGDSRAYRLRGGELDVLTHDHTWVAEQVSAGNISEVQARSHPFKSVVTRALGGESEVEVEVLDLEAAPGDLYLLCSDGLTSMVPDERILQRLTSDEPLERVCAQLVEEANERGGRDNITVLLLRLEEDSG